MIKTVVLDIGQVLAAFRWEDYLLDCGYNKETREKVARATVLSKYWGEQDRGSLPEEEIIRLCCELEPSVSTEIRKFFEDITLTVVEYPYAKEFIRDLKKNGYKVYLLSNYGERNFSYAREHFSFIPEADGQVISYEIKNIKPEPEIYEALLQKFGFQPEEAVFLDDSEANLKGAEKFGFHTILVTDFDKALGDLRKLGVRI